MRTSIIKVCLTFAVLAQLCLAFPAPFNTTENADGGAALWVKWVTGGERLTLWDNSAQVAEEQKNPPSDPKHEHPAVTQTRWNLDSLITGGAPPVIASPHSVCLPSSHLLTIPGAPDGWTFAMLEIGESWFCGPGMQPIDYSVLDACLPDQCEYTLFGLETVNGGDVQLHSYTTYNNKYAEGALRALHKDHNLKGPLLDFSNMKEDAVKLVYKYGFNSTAGATVFFGQGGGPTGDGGKLVVQETVAPDYVAPLELFYNSAGSCSTPYSTPIVYRRQK